MAHMDIFNDDAFSMVELTAALDKVPYKPQFLGELAIFESRPVRTVEVSIEKRDNKLALIQTSERGAPPTPRSNEKRDIRSFQTVRLAHDDTIYAHEIQNIRAFGSESELQQVQQDVARRMEYLRQDVELTHENMRLGAVQGIVTDADGSTLRNWYTEWGIVQAAEIDFELDDTSTNVRGKCQEVIRAMQRNAKGAWLPTTQVHSLCADEFYDALIDHTRVRDTYLNWAAATELRDNQAFRSFPFSGIFFHNYRGTDDNSTVAVASDKAKFFPVGARGAFQVAWSPGESFDFVNTPGRPTYSMMIPDRDRNSWVKVEEYSYPLFICTRPEMLQRGKRA